MSYILDALRKAERERPVSRVPTLSSAHGDGQSASWPPWALAIGVALAVSAIVALAVLWVSARPSPVREPAAAPPVVSRSASEATSVAPSSPSAPALPPGTSGSEATAVPRPTAAPPRVTETTGRGQSATAPSRPPAPTHAAQGGDLPAARAPGHVVEQPPGGATPVRPTPAPDAPAAAAPMPGPIARPGADVPRALDAATSSMPPTAGHTAVAQAPVPQAPVPQAPVPPAPVPSAPAAPKGPPAVPPTGGGATVPSPPAAAPPANPAAPADAGSGQPAEPRAGETPPRFTLDVLVYSEVPAERLVFINGHKYVEGQAVDGGAVVQRITPDGAVLRHEGKEILLRPKLNPYTRSGSP